jgi:hypothetical protein
MVGDHCVKLQGRTYSFLPPARQGVGPSGGLSYFTFDSRAALAGHAESRNTSGNSGSHAHTDVVKPQLLSSIYTDLVMGNRLCREVARFGESSHLQELLKGATPVDAAVAVIAKVSTRYNTHDNIDVS